jgi:hypothetical protein
MGLTATQHAFRRRRWGSLNIGGMDIESLIVEAIFRISELEDRLGTDWVADRETARRVGWIAVKHPGVVFQVGRRLLELAAPDGYPMPPAEFRLSRQTEPTWEEERGAPYLQPWNLVLFSDGSRPALWELTGWAYHREWEYGRRTWRLLYLYREKRMAMTEDGWVRLGRRFAT